MALIQSLDYNCKQLVIVSTYTDSTNMTYGNLGAGIKFLYNFDFLRYHRCSEQGILARRDVIIHTGT